jgi:hypothetical protein
MAAKAKDAKVCAWRGCGAKPTRILTWEEGVQQEFCDFHADSALSWADVREKDWALKQEEANG